MGRHRTVEEKRALGERARELRAGGRSRREIQAELGIGDDLAKALLRGVELPPGRRPHVKRAEREAALAMRREGKSYNEIARELNVSKGTLSAWLRAPHGESASPAADDDVADRQVRREEARRLRQEGLLLSVIAARLQVSAKTIYYWTCDLPVPASSRPGGDHQHMEMMRRRYWDRMQRERADERERIQGEHAARVGALSPRELELLAVTAYWCEGSKSKPYDRREQVTFINSDPGLVVLWLAWLDQVAHPREHRRYALSIHESADVGAATDWWSAVIGIPAADFDRPMLKRHNPKTVRKNIGDAYVGCLVVRLTQCRTLYQQIEGVWQGIMTGLPQSGAPSRVVQWPDTAL